MALAIVGLTVAIEGIVLVGSTLYAWLTTPAEAAVIMLNLERRTALVRGGLNVLIGAILFLGHDAIRRGWHRLRTAR